MASDVKIVLVAPSHPGNIGGAARAMKCMGFGDLGLVRPARFPDPQASWRAAGAQDVLDRATVHDDLDQATSECVLVVGTSARQRHLPLPCDSAREFAERLAAEAVEGPVAVLFGRETSGLTNDELARCSRQVVIPAAGAYSSLNLAMAVQVVCYELHLALGRAAGAVAGRALGGDGVESGRWDRAPATASALAGLHEHLERVLGDIGFLDPRAPRRTMARLRRLIGRIRADETEVAILRGILSHIERATAARLDSGSADATGPEHFPTRK